MAVKYILSDYVDEALDRALYDKLDDGTFAGRIPDCPGAIAFADSLRACESELRATLEDWLLVGLKLGHTIPVVAGIDLNGLPEHERVEPLNGATSSNVSVISDSTDRIRAHAINT